MVVFLLSSSPKNGVELMDGVESITRGWWRPTPGSIYPLLKELSDQGVVKKREDGRYELTAKGRAQSQVPFGPPLRSTRTMNDMVGQMNSLVSYMEDAKNSQREDLKPHMGDLKGLAKRLSDLASEEPNDEGKS
jgi:DNA-binding PadR family transcriptional regulator